MSVAPASIYTPRTKRQDFELMVGKTTRGMSKEPKKPRTLQNPKMSAAKIKAAVKLAAEQEAKRQQKLDAELRWLEDAAKRQTAAQTQLLFTDLETFMITKRLGPGDEQKARNRAGRAYQMTASKVLAENNQNANHIVLLWKYWGILEVKETNKVNMATSLFGLGKSEGYKSAFDERTSLRRKIENGKLWVQQTLVHVLYTKGVTRRDDNVVGTNPETDWVQRMVREMRRPIYDLIDKHYQKGLDNLEKAVNSPPKLPSGPKATQIKAYIEQMNVPMIIKMIIKNEELMYYKTPWGGYWQ